MKNKYSFQEIDNEIRDSSLRISQVFDERNKLRDNWNSLRDYCEKNKYFYTGLQGEDREEDLSIIDVLEKMNELEGSDKE